MPLHGRTIVLALALACSACSDAASLTDEPGAGTQAARVPDGACALALRSFPDTVTSCDRNRAFPIGHGLCRLVAHTHTGTDTFVFRADERCGIADSAGFISVATRSGKELDARQIALVLDQVDQVPDIDKIGAGLPEGGIGRKRLEMLRDMLATGARLRPTSLFVESRFWPLSTRDVTVRADMPVGEGKMGFKIHFIVGADWARPESIRFVVS
jgi:hypothetical protein